MKTTNISDISNLLVLHFQTKTKSINAYTLASTLVSIADTAKAANKSINFGYDIEIIVEALESGSFRAILSAVYKKSKNLFSDQKIHAIILAIIANYIYERTFSLDHSFNIQVNTTEVIITKGNERVIVPRIVYDATKEVASNPEFKHAATKIINTIADDDKIDGLAITSSSQTKKEYMAIINKELLQQVAKTEDDELATRIIKEHCELQIIKAILEKSRRKWEFSWRGIRISAPLTDMSFYKEFSEHKCTIAPGDKLIADLLIKQSQDPNTGIYTNQGYEVAKVHKHVTANFQSNNLEYK